MARDYYEVLGVNKQSSADEIKKAYRNLARKFHPDVNKEAGSADKFKELNEAYQVLSDPQKRSQYDYFGQAGGPQGAGGFGGGFEGFDFGGGAGNFGDLGDLFEMFFNGRQGATRQHGGPQRGEDLRLDLRITLVEAAKGVEKELEVPHYVACTTCKGSGAKPGTTPVKCATCQGAGQVKKTQRTVLGSFAQIVTCPTCHGSGSSNASPCPTCHGNGREKKKHTVKVKVPAGIDSGYRLRVAGAGNAGTKGGSPGDLYVFIEVQPHPLFNRDGANLYYRTEITFLQAILGDELKVPTIDGEATLKVPPGTQPNTNFRLKEKGLPQLQGKGKGDLYVLVEVKIPTKLSKGQEELLRQYKNA
ncbi:MAG: molecular chaperone DnaJ [Candidatus Margulisbacteria bacterium]|jgi:molecular chaperone DnaJ|nr:molecular chaperone DnaJ [Candidatus Margulisiibacteriota bacterium]